ncbi:hypothetical protein NYR55_11585 [Sphingomonas sp. BGYR3]|uniref:spike base protein, RCAP_Rcc01079 family n=1 Tax=Sphingomonas sp. BGYR3 TaxID=2975483 RepID=UPI0021A69AB4|nr:hypothetical protein [Sphingomonas sp. BGYR3]MDG5489256.1 hypothetical protein [Sphingomonas sp. BGYR3]
MTDRFVSFKDSVDAPARHCFAVVPSDSQPLPHVTKALRAGGAGTITFRAIGDTADTQHPVLNGERIDVRVSHVRQTGTTVPVMAYA